MLTIILALLIFGLLIVAHEGGHFLAAKWAGMKVEEFSVGLGPAIWQARRGETLYSLRILPLGGYNRIAGMEEEDQDDPRGFNRQPLTKRMIVIAAGSAMNFLLAILIFILVFMGFGIPQDLNVVGGVQPGMPAQQVGLRPGDKILEVDGHRVESWSQLVSLIRSRPEQRITLLVDRGGDLRKIEVTTVREPQTGAGLIGITPPWARENLYNSIVLGLQQSLLMVKMIILSLLKMVRGKAGAEVVGPVGIVQMVGQAATGGLVNVLSFTAVLSLNLGLINLLPIPALDGSRLAFLFLEALRGRPLDPRKENLIHLIGFILLLALLLLVTYKDIMRIFFS
ncbi:MAG TPA: RIP metalloprotease RseP [Moorella mulderi]|mgnify:CR=1 FL=1|nr:RIP metalloprotease RseP [Moorella mulderi]